MLTTLTLITILVFISLPAARNFLADAQDQILQQQLLHAIELAKCEAEARHVPIALCASSNQTSCSDHFEDGQLIFLDENEDGTINDHQQIIAVLQTHSHRGRIYSRSFPRYRHYLLFSPAGMLESDNATFWHCHDNLPIWAIMLNKSGRTRVVPADKNGELKDSLGHSLICTLA